jgi:hypothetical protein
MNQNTEKLFNWFRLLNVIPWDPKDILTFSKLTPDLEKALLNKKIYVQLFFSPSICKEVYLTLSQIKVLAPLYLGDRPNQQELLVQVLRGDYVELFDLLVEQGIAPAPATQISRILKKNNRRISLCDRITNALIGFSTRFWEQ